MCPRDDSKEYRVAKTHIQPGLNQTMYTLERKFDAEKNTKSALLAALQDPARWLPGQIGEKVYARGTDNPEHRL
jgi:hypothetical protein